MPHSGSCLCGAVRFTVEGDLPPPDGCHCVNCRKQTGHYLVSTDVPKAALSVTGADHVGWFQSSEKVRRGFCTRCGSTLFWDPVFRDWIGVAMGAFDSPTDTHQSKHIFTSEKGDYYDIADGLPQNLR
ncbi:GFA family protein [Neotabrizicola shimadae]|uniref:GFA family protein n=1 Tax=Neotabrizicola shimadae TaxID=2807096 RepID=A0A8G0ZU92_9RHOB|nr:GFA family protein [Neotabrizicola shimadae]QYZ68745.1 GFA family protein [Neotabrizicola shimadae]